jgi:hypothetical protein
MNLADYKKLETDLKHLIQLALNGIDSESKEYKDICLRMIKQYVSFEMLMEDEDE